MRGRTEVLWRVARNTFWDAYDHLGTLVLSNFLSFVMCMAAGVVPFALTEATSLWWLLLALPLVAVLCCAAGMLRVTYNMAVRREARARDFFGGMAVLWRPATALGLISLAVLCLAAANIAFYVDVGGTYPMVGLALAAFCLWVTLAFFVCLQFVLPAATELWTVDAPGPQVSVSEHPVIHYEQLRQDGTPRTVGASLRIGLTLLLHAPVVAAVVFTNLALFWVLCLATGGGVVFLAAGVTCLTLHHAYGETVAEIAGLGDRRAEESRSLRELVRPWEAQKGRGSGSGGS